MTSRSKGPWISFALALFAMGASAQTCPLVEDLNTLNAGSSSNPAGHIGEATVHTSKSFPELNGYWYMSGYTKATGRELFRTDGTQAGSSLVFNASAGSANSVITDIVVYAGKVWFVAEMNVGGQRLFVTDGTPSGTTQLASGFVEFSDLIGLGGKLYFGHAESSAGPELWVSDGTKTGTGLLVDLNPDPTKNSDVRHLALGPLGTKLYFQATDGVNGNELWTTDGSAAGTVMVADLEPGSSGSILEDLTVFGTRMLFVASTSAYGYELWSTDGTAAGTQLVLDLDGTPGSTGVDLSHSAEMGGELYYGVSSAPLGYDLWKTDGTTAGTVPVIDINPTGAAVPWDLMVLNGLLFFSADDGVHGRELWRSDGTAVGTTLVDDIFPGPGSGSQKNAGAYAVKNGELYFVATDGLSGQELWKTDGVTTTQVADIDPGPPGSYPSWFTPLDANRFLFRAKDTLHGTELWVTDGSTLGTMFFLDLDYSATDSSTPMDMHSVGGSYFLFTADDGVIGRELYRWDRTSGVTLLGDLAPGPGDSGAGGFFSTMVGGQWLTLFSANDGVHGSEPWVTDGTVAGTHMLLDLNLSGSSAGFTSLNMEDHPIVYHPGHQRVYFTASDGISGHELWSTDGTAAGTQLFVDLNVGPNGSGPLHLTPLGDQLLFTAYIEGHGRELYVSDGTAAGTGLLFSPLPIGGDGDPDSLTVFGDKVVFFSWYQGYGRELFVTDGTFAGTTLIRDLEPGSAGSDPNSAGTSSEFVEYNGFLYFVANTSASGKELWRTDLTWAGTTLTSDVQGGNKDSLPTDLTLAGDGMLYFHADGGPSLGNQLYRTDGSIGGHTLIPFRPYPIGTTGNEYDLFPLGNGVAFTTVDAFGVEVHKVAGITPTVTTLCSLTPEGGHGDAVLCDGDIFVVAQHPMLGWELFQVALPGPYVVDLGLGWSGIQLAATDPILGANLTITVEDPLTPGVGFLLLSGHQGTPMAFPLDPQGVLWVDLFSFQILATIPTPSWSQTFPIPPNPALAGASVALQSFHLPGLTFPGTTSNGLQLVIGN